MFKHFSEFLKRTSLFLLVIILSFYFVSINSRVYSLEDCDNSKLRGLGVIIIDCNNNTQSECSVERPPIDPGENARAVWEFFADKLPGHQIAGIIGNMQTESGVQPQRLQSTGDGVITPAETVDLTTPLGWGLVQWTPASKMIDKFNPRSDANSLENQLIFLWDQLEGRGPLPEKSAGDQLKQTTSVDEATRIFMLKFERPKVQTKAAQDERVVNAEGAYLRFKDLIPTVDAPVGSTGSSEFESSCEPTSTTNGFEAIIVEKARAELALSPIEYDTNVMKYTDGNEERWCADFVSWIYKEAGVPFSGGASGGWRWPSVLNLQEMFKNTSGYEYFVVGERAPQPGDVAFYIGAQTPDGGSDRHVNIVVEVDESSFTTIGGNESNRVKLGTRQLVAGANSLVGFGRKTVN